ncbi:MAG TPA: DUF2177 family protein [Hansschlegelia sp.]
MEHRAVLRSDRIRDYDLTNLATLRDWPAALSVVDMAWGALLTAVSATAGSWSLRP